MEFGGGVLELVLWWSMLLGATAKDASDAGRDNDATMGLNENRVDLLCASCRIKSAALPTDDDDEDDTNDRRRTTRSRGEEGGFLARAAPAAARRFRWRLWWARRHTHTRTRQEAFSAFIFQTSIARARFMAWNVHACTAYSRACARVDNN